MPDTTTTTPLIRPAHLCYTASHTDHNERPAAPVTAGKDPHTIVALRGLAGGHQYRPAPAATRERESAVLAGTADWPATRPPPREGALHFVIV
jgi:hypothetical protein